MMMMIPHSDQPTMPVSRQHDDDDDDDYDDDDDDDEKRDDNVVDDAHGTISFLRSQFLA